MIEKAFGVGTAIFLLVLMLMAATLMDRFNIGLMLAIKFSLAVLVVAVVSGWLSFLGWRPMNVAALAIFLLWISLTGFMPTEIVVVDDWDISREVQTWYTTWWGRFLLPAIAATGYLYYRFGR